MYKLQADLPLNDLLQNIMYNILYILSSISFSEKKTTVCFRLKIGMFAHNGLQLSLYCSHSTVLVRNSYSWS